MTGAATAAPAAVLSAALLAGCAAAPGAPASGDASLSLVPAAGGLEVAGSGGREIGFGRARDGAVASAARASGERPRLVPCGAREGVGLGDLVMAFDGGRFVGWSTPTASAGAACAG